jgi:hypothetical protein
MVMKAIKIGIVFFCFILYGCCNSNVNKHVQEICDSKEILINEFSNTTIIGNRSMQSLQIEYHYKAVSSKFSFERSDSGLILFYKEVNFPIENLSTFFKEDSVYSYTDTNTVISLIKIDLERKLELMDSLGILSVSADEKCMGIDLKLYIEEGIVNYISNIDSVQNPIWKNYVDSLIKVEDDMYFDSNCK